MSAAVVGGGIDPFEADTGENEEINDLISIIFPQNYINFLQFTFSYNKKIFNGWVKQPSPCCAAASLAGALNALGNFHRSDDRALNHLDILYIYECILRRSIEKKKTSFERCLGGSIDELLQLLDAEILQLDQNDKKRKKVIGKLTLVRLIKKIVTEKIGESIVPLQEDSSIPLMPSTYALLAELLAAEENQSTEDNTKVSILELQHC